MQHLYFTTFLEEQQKFSGSLKFSLWFMVPPENNQCPEKQGRSFYQAVINKVKFEPVLKNVRRLSPKFCLQVYIKNLLSPYLLPPLSCKLYETLMGHHFFFFFFFLFWLKWEVFDLCHWRQWLSFHWAQWEHVSACKDLQSMFLVEVVQIVLIQLNFNKVYQLYYLDLTECEKPLQVSQPPSSSSLPVFLPSWKAQTFFQIYLFGTVHPLNFPAPRTLRSVALQDPWRIFLLPAWGRDWRAPKSHQSV